MRTHLKDMNFFTRVPEIGDTVLYWFSKEEGNVLDVRPYDGKNPEHFTHIIRLKSKTPRGWMETVINVPSAREK
jgi:hypothetical protein